MKTYWTSLTKDYVADWGAPEAIREILQNFLDSPAPFEYNFDGRCLEFTNKGITLHQSTILMGNSSKRNEVDSLGGKGEGYKIACLVLLREGYTITIFNGTKLWLPRFEYNNDFEQEVLIFLETESLSPSDDLTFRIEGVDDDLTCNIIDQCLYLQEDLGTVYTGQRGRVLADKPGKLYVGGLFVCDIEGHKYSYDFHPKFLPLNRDRKSVSGWDLANNVTQLLQETLPTKELANLVLDRSKDAGGGYSSFRSSDVADEVYNRTKEQYGDLVVVADCYDEEKKLKDRGYKNVEVVNSDQYNMVIKSPQYLLFLEELDNVVEPEDTRTPIEMMWDWLSENERYLPIEVHKKFRNLVGLFTERGVSFDG